MTNQIASDINSKTWQEQLSTAVSHPSELLAILDLPGGLLAGALKGDAEFKTRVPYAYISRMESGNPNDPLLKQVLPVDDETLDVSGFTMDPLSEQDSNPSNGVIHKYKGRLLLIVSGACAINCRFCFRRHFPYGDNQLAGESFQQAIDYIKKQEDIHEVILSGGDPLAASDKRLKKLVEALAEIEHLKTIRIHTRLPIVIPDRVTAEMLNWLTGTRLKPVIVVHTNHASEIDNNVASALRKLKRSGVTLLNQTVLLKGINDSADALANLSHKLFQADVLPYYLHLLDKVKGAAHFDISEQKAQNIVRELMAQCPGYLVPKLVREIAGEPGKTSISV
ncbi:EF-P beta-lysylation protein EpmB [Endozoicomonas sp. OPT23]|uniref:EF-P beta-lysylation protein EpmB n=1 Tax=Endozoicomonas sp. OPT23 TaxID=2072845 RepID=UPI00129AD441|nr:EF-P beta-lysylation protein EpmB [Endozoicomonas sp. OPT23]MRI35441.1 EF-P beta-lysylation protein EpmB [Endozoicomonas sp. OPT23]